MSVGTKEVCRAITVAQSFRVPRALGWLVVAGMLLKEVDGCVGCVIPARSAAAADLLAATRQSHDSTLTRAKSSSTPPSPPVKRAYCMSHVAPRACACVCVTSAGLRVQIKISKIKGRRRHQSI